MSDAPVPEWVSTEVRYWIDIFNLEGWGISVSLDRVVNDNPHCMGWCERNANYNQATLHFRTDIEDTDDWRRVILHECLHIVMARVDAFVSDAVIPEMAESSQRFAGVGYTQNAESFVQMLTGSFWRYYKAQMTQEVRDAGN